MAGGAEGDALGRAGGVRALEIGLAEPGEIDQQAGVERLARERAYVLVWYGFGATAGTYYAEYFQLHYNFYTLNPTKKKPQRFFAGVQKALHPNCNDRHS